MRKFKIALWIILLVFIFIFLYQNQQFFFQMDQTFRINLGFAEYQTPGISLALLLLICIAIGFIVSYAVSIPGRITTRKKMNNLKKAVEDQRTEIETLNKKIINDTNIRESTSGSGSTDAPHSTYR